MDMEQTKTASELTREALGLGLWERLTVDYAAGVRVRPRLTEKGRAAGVRFVTIAEMENGLMHILRVK